MARAIHLESPGEEKAFIKVNCAALPESLLESELFGHEKGALPESILAGGRESEPAREREVRSPVKMPGFHRSLKDIEREEEVAALDRHGWVQARAARELGLTQRQIGYRIKKDKLKPPENLFI